MSKEVFIVMEPNKELLVNVIGVFTSYHKALEEYNKSSNYFMTYSFLDDPESDQVSCLEDSWED